MSSYQILKDKANKERDKTRTLYERYKDHDNDYVCNANIDKAHAVGRLILNGYAEPTNISKNLIEIQSNIDPNRWHIARQYTGILDFYLFHYYERCGKCI